MRLTIETNSLHDIEMLMTLFKTVSWENIKIINPSKTKISTPNITKGNKKLNPRQLFGIWKDNPRNIEQIRRGQ